MKKDIHPTYNLWVQVKCICSNVFEVNSAVRGPIVLDTCPKCHSTYNSGLKIIKESRGRQQAYEERMAKIAKKTA